MKVMEHNFYDPNSIIGCILSFMFMLFGMFTLGEWAIVTGIGVGVSTIVYNVIKILKEIKRKL